MERRRSDFPPLLRSLSQRGKSPTNGQPIPDMESVVATVTGYQGSHRFNLIKLISHSGASYVGKMSRSITHLVCWQYEGKKYELAKKFKTIIINHRWIEDCIAQGKRVSVDSYVSKCGHEVGPILLKVPFGGLSTKKHLVRHEKSNIDDCRTETMNKEARDSCNNVFIESILLSKDSFYNCGTARKTYNKKLKGTSIQEHEIGPSKKYHFQEPRVFEIMKNDVSITLRSAKDETKNANFCARTTIETSRKRRLIKKNICPIATGSMPLDVDSQITEHGSCNPYGDASTSSGRRLVGENMSANASGSTPLDVVGRSTEHGVHDLCSDSPTSSGHSAGGNNAVVVAPKNNSNEKIWNKRKFQNALELVQEIEDNDNEHALSNTSAENKSIGITRSSQDGLSSVDVSEGPIEVVAHTQHTTASSTAADLSCVICWTDFSCTRGILPCGHRFCYSCIQNWADHMASMRKVSTCPLCKASFLHITKIEDAATFDQKIYSQTIPCAIPRGGVVVLADQEAVDAQIGLDPVCSVCQCREPEDLLLTCNVCQIQHIHSYCLDPPLLPWSCLHCKDLQMLFHPTY